MNKKQFTPVFLYAEEKARKAELENYGSSILELNKLVTESEVVLKRKLSDNEKFVLSKQGAKYIIDKVKASFKFKNATDQFNLDSEGIDLEPLKAQDIKYSRFYLKYDYSLVKGLFEEDEEQIKIIMEATQVFTTNANQNKVLELGEKYVKFCEELQDLGLLKEHQFSFAIDPYPFMTTVGHHPTENKGNRSIVVNKEYINRMIK